jgi:hypothetical protein
MPTTTTDQEPELFSPETQEFFGDAIHSAKLRVAFAESMLVAAQRELDDARASLHRLEGRRKKLGVTIVTNNPDQLELPDDISMLSEDHAYSVGSRSTMFIGSVSGMTAGTKGTKESGFSFKNSLRNLRLTSGRSVSSAPVTVHKKQQQVLSPLSSTDSVGDDVLPTRRSLTPEPPEVEGGEGENKNTVTPDRVKDDSSSTDKATKITTVFAISPDRTESTAAPSVETGISEEENEDAQSRASALSAALEKEDEAETIEYAIFKQHLRDHYSPPRTENVAQGNNTEAADQVSNFEPMQIDMVTMDTIIEEPADPEDGVASVEVVGCGVSQVNGSYLKFDARDGVPTYSKIEIFEGHETMFTIGRWAATNGTRKWYITAIVPGQSRSKSVFYVSYSMSNVPPKEGWMVVDEGFDLFLVPEYAEKGVMDAPRLEWETDDDAASVANTYLSRRSSLSNAHYYEVGKQVLSAQTREKDEARPSE